MTTPTRFCSHCGKPLKAEARFCGSCGQPVQPEAQPAPPAAAVQPAEQVIGIIANGTRKKGFMGMSADLFHLVVTSSRIIFATQTADMRKEEALRAKEAAKEKGKGFFGQMGAQLTGNTGQKYLAMAPQAVMAEQPGNFYVDYNQVRSVKTRSYSDDESSRTEYHLVIETATGKIDILFDNLDEKQVKIMLNPMLGNRIK